MNLALRCLSVALAVVLPGAGAWATDYEVVTRPNLECSGLIALLHRLGLEYHKPNAIPRKLRIFE
jgi:hypothetical protein